MLGTVDKKLEEMGITLPPPAAPIANYVPAVRTGNLLFLAGAGPSPGPDGKMPRGKLGEDVSVEEGYKVARSVGLVQIAVDLHFVRGVHRNRPGGFRPCVRRDIR